MRNTIEFIVLIALLVLGQLAVDERRRAPREAARAFGMWFLFFGAITALMFYPEVVAWLLRALVALGAYWVARALFGGVLGWLRGPSIIPRVKPRQAVETAREVLLDGHAASSQARRAFGALKPAVKEHGAAAFLRAVLEMSMDSERPNDPKAQAALLADRAGQAAADANAVCADAARAKRFAAGRVDQRLVAEALLVYDAASVARLLTRGKAALGSRAARKAAVETLAKDAKPAAWQETLAEVGLYSPPDERRKEGKAKPARIPGKRLALSIALPPTGFLAAGERRRAAVLAGVSAALLAYALYALAAGRTVGWIFLATWGLMHILGAFAACELSEG